MVYRTSRIKLANGQIYWREAGDNNRPVVIFLHGSWHDGGQWEKLVDLICKDFHCFTLDLPGFGSSIGDEPIESIDNIVDILSEFFDALKLRSVYLVGHSLGAWVAVSYALKYPELTRGIVTIAPEGYSLATWKQYGLPTKFLLAHPRLFDLWRKGFNTIRSDSNNNSNPLQKNRGYWNFFTRFPTTCKLFFERSAKEIERELVAERVSQLRPALLVLQSDSDDSTVIEQSQGLASAVENAEYKSLGILKADDRDESLRQIATEIRAFCDRVQLKIDREEVELW